MAEISLNNLQVQINDKASINHTHPELSNPSRTSGKQIFTSSGSFVVPEGVTQVLVTAIGGGGGGGSGGGSGSGYSGLGGYGGQAAKHVFMFAVTVTPNAVIPVTVGAGGLGNTGTATVGGAGGASSFGSYVTVPGGAGGNGGVTKGGNADYDYLPTNGGSGAMQPLIVIFDSRITSALGGTASTAGNAGATPVANAYGCGGGGGGGASNGSGGDGGNGGNGMVLVEW